MIRRFRFGNPLETGSIPEKPAITTNEALPYFDVSENGARLSLALGKSRVYGLGEQVRGINKRGWTYTSNNSDQPHHTETQHSLYGSHNFLLADGLDTKEDRLPVRFGVFFDYPGAVTYDIGYTDNDQMLISFPDADYDAYIIDGDSDLDIISQFRALIGRSYIPPKWAFGFGQCRWSYMSEDEVRSVADGYQKNDIPLDMIYLDIDYMKDYKDFTVNEETFPDFASFVQEMKNRHIHLVPIIDAGVRIEKGYRTYEEGVADNYFCKDEDGKDFVAAVWPGKVHFPDFLNSGARRWFGDSYRFLLDKGIEGFWNDMNEPAIFYSEKNLKRFFERIESYKGKNLDIQSFFEMTGLAAGLANNEEDYRSFYHDMDGIRVRHDKVHNLFGYNMTRAAGEAFERNVPDKRILMFSRSSFVGSHRYGGIWMGDNTSWWSHMKLELAMLANLNMTGFLYTGADIGGFGGDTTPDLVLRWLALGIFTPLMRNHSAMGTRYQEAYRFGPISNYRNIMQLRYALIPYIYSEYMKAATENAMYAKPLAFVYPDDARAAEIEDELIIGNEILIAPVMEQNKTGRFVYLPENMRLFRFRNAGDFDTEDLAKGDHYVKCAVNEVLMFMRKGHMIPLAKPAESVDQIDWNDLSWIGYPDGKETVYDLYNDDGETKDYDPAKHITHITRSLQ
ncbi:MAG: TIM-barrel domain-containing protein [Eubacteriales bacterium]|jgi:alpha-glucosidase